MPLYDYHCQFCDEVSEHLINANDPEPKCRFCQGSMVRLLSKPAHYSGAATQWVNHNLDNWGPEGSKFKE